MQEGNIAIIGGTGFEQLPPEIFAEEVSVETPHGKVTVLSVSDNYVEPHKLYFVSRHGATHGIAPHQIDYSANIKALEMLGVKYAIATNAVGSLRTNLQPGELVLFDDFIDFTRNRTLTYFQDEHPWSHVDFSVPYSDVVRAAILETSAAMGVDVHPRCTYLCADGPRFETPAEVRLFASWGADVVGMTGLPEAVFAREAGIEYAAVGIVTNLAAGLASGTVSHEAVATVMCDKLATVRELLVNSCAAILRQPIL